MENIEEKLSIATQKAIKVIEDKVFNLPYFNNKFYNLNCETFGKRLVDEDFLPNGMVALYVSHTNLLYIQRSSVEKLDVDTLTELILHEFLHFLSADRENDIVGYTDSSIPITFNEGCTQYLTLKLLYEDKLDERINENIIYPESVKTIGELSKIIGEENLFGGYFLADVKILFKSLDLEKRSILTDTILRMSSSGEEIISKQRLGNLLDAVRKVLPKEKK